MDPIAPASIRLGDIAAPSASAGENTSQLAADLDEFLVLLTAQLENQDPLNPMDPNQFTDQLTQLSQLEQQVEQTDQLEAVNAALAALTARADAVFLGTTVETTTESAVLLDDEARITVEVADAADAVRVEILDQAGNVAAVLEGPGEAGVATLVWDGRDAQGDRRPDGVYGVRASAVTGDTARAIPALLSGRVEELRYTESGAFVRLDDGSWTPLDQTRAVAAGS